MVEQIDDSVSSDPLMALMAARGELTDEDVDEQQSVYDSGRHRRGTFEVERTNVTAGAAEYELKQFSLNSV
jgi:hypothetical protein